MSYSVRSLFWKQELWGKSSLSFMHPLFLFKCYVIYEVNKMSQFWREVSRFGVGWCFGSDLLFSHFHTETDPLSQFLRKGSESFFHIDGWPGFKSQLAHLFPLNLQINLHQQKLVGLLLFQHHFYWLFKTFCLLLGIGCLSWWLLVHRIDVFTSVSVVCSIIRSTTHAAADRCVKLRPTLEDRQVDWF